MVFPIPPRRYVPTGRVRGRRQAITGKILMQLEETIQVNDIFLCPAPPWCKTAEERQKWLDDQRALFDKCWRSRGTQWRDATLDDLVGDSALTTRNN